MPINLIAIVGPTASGKTALAVRLARRLGSEVISADSRQVYRGMDIGTGKDLAEYVRDGVAIPHHLIDIMDPREEFHLFAYQRLFFQCFQDLRSRGLVPVLVGGTGLYLDAVLRGYRMLEVPENQPLRQSLDGRPLPELAAYLRGLTPAIHNTTDLLDRKRLVRAIEIAAYEQTHGRDPGPAWPRLEPLVCGVRWERSILRQRIIRRLRDRLDAGMAQEVQALHDGGVSWERLDALGLEYRYVGRYLQGILGYEEMVCTLGMRIHQFAKRQETWFRRMERNGVAIHWIDGADGAALERLLDRYL